MSWLRKATPERRPSQARSDVKPTPQNPTLFQSFEWHTPDKHYQRLSSILDTLSDIGITSLWLPPGCKANSTTGNGYDCYDLWDLGEFDQKWSRSTKWGSKEELDGLIRKAKGLGLSVIWDAVLNHKTAGDSTEECWAVEVDPNDRRREISSPRKIEPWIHYNFPGRGNTYSSLKWHWQHFNGTDWDQRGQKHAIFKVIDSPESYPKPGVPHTRRRKDWAPDVDDENGNADYLMFSNIDYTNDEVRQDVLNWGRWMVHDVGLDGFRLDAVQHYSWRFVKEWVSSVKKTGTTLNRDVLIVGEFWNYDVNKLVQWTERVGQGVKAYDAPLLRSLAIVSLAKSVGNSVLDSAISGVDLRKIFRSTLVNASPDSAVTVVRNHDTQPGQATDTYITPTFRSSAYALILLREEGLPCVFYGDLYGISGPYSEPPSCYDRLPSLILARNLYAYGEQMDYFDSRTSIGWTRIGTWDRQDGCAVIVAISGSVKKRMYVGADKAGQIWTDLLDNSRDEILIDERGFGRFVSPGRCVCVFVSKTATGRDRFPPPFNADIYRSMD